MTDTSSTPPETGFKGGVRQSMSWLHTWVGLVLGVVLYFMFITGTAGYFNAEITRWMEGTPSVSTATVSDRQMIEMGLAVLERELPEASYWGLELPGNARVTDGTIRVMGTPLDENAEFSDLHIDPTNGEIVLPRDDLRQTGGGDALYAMHYALHYMPEITAMYIVGVATMFMLVAIITGIIVHKKFFKDMFTFRPGKGQRSWLDAHNLSSVLTLPFILMITYSGLILYTYQYMPSVRAALYGGPMLDSTEPLAEHDAANAKFGQELAVASENQQFYELVADGKPATLAAFGPVVDEVEKAWGPNQIGWFEIMHPHDTAGVITAWTKASETFDYDVLYFDSETGTQLVEGNTVTPNEVGDVLVNLHYGMFAKPLLRWFYFLSGLAGAAMIATGLVLWTTKRRQALRRDQLPDFGLRFIERLNAGVIVGLPVGVLAYFWANRLIPPQMEGRADWETNALFITWGLMLVHAALRRADRVWIDQLALAAAMSALVPVVGALTTDVNLVQSLVAGDWVLAGFDLTMLGFAVAFGLTASKLWRRPAVLRAEKTASIKRTPTMEPAE
jgi:uncharacterized iron-regulated membrane protein